MTNEEVQKVLDELQGVRPEVLNDEAKRLFEAIMKICDQRDIYKNELIKLGIKTEIKNNDVEEIWKDIKGYEGLYQVSNFGKIKSLSKNNHNYGENGKILKGINNKGYLRVGLSKNGKAKQYPIHRIVAETFIDNVYNLPCVNHIDENKMNNRADNLEWCSVEYNNNYGNRNKKISINQRYANNKPIKCLETGQIFISLNECARKLNIKPPNIWASMNNYNRTKKAKGYTFKYIELEEIINERDLLKEQLDYVVNEYGATIEKQDKIINEMADFIVHCDIDEDICQYMQDYMQDGGCGDRLECKKCIIEFYSKKVGE